MKRKFDFTIEEELYLIGWIGLALFILGSFLYFTVWLRFIPFSCVFHHFTGFYCPGCGGTRAFLALIHGQILLSLWYHPIVLYTAVIYSGFMGTQTLQRLKVKGIRGWKFHEWYLYGAVVLLFYNFFLKNILHLFFHIDI